LDAATNTYSSLPAVTSAVANHDKRCVACHDSGTAADGPTAVASPHTQTTTQTDTPLPVGTVWADPFGEWRRAFDSDAGSGHNVVPYDVAGASQDRDFPQEHFTVLGRTLTWSLPPNSGPTTWLRASVFGTATVATTETIKEIMIGCDDCHVIPDSAKGPHGAAVRVYIDPEYSQTEYANPTWNAYQWSATGTDRVICFKCHPMDYASGESTPGGQPLHYRHANYNEFGHGHYTPDQPNYWGSKCVDCHVRIPHAWQRPRLTVRTVETTLQPVADQPPYVREDHQGLLGILLKDQTTHTRYMSSSSCATGDCYTSPRILGRHPLPSSLPTDTLYWP
jgi:hypothetical protein